MMLFYFIGFVIFGFPILGYLTYILGLSDISDFDFLSLRTNTFEPLILLLMGSVSYALAYFMSNHLSSDKKLNITKNNELHMDEIRFVLGKYSHYIALFCAVFFFIFQGWMFFPERYGYRVEISFLPSLYALAGMFGLLSIFTLGFTYGSNKNAWKYIALFIFFIVFLAFFSKASRIFALAPTLFLLSSCWAGKKFSTSLSVSLILLPFLLTLSLQLRGLNLQGFLPFIEYFFTDVDFSYDKVLRGIISNFSSTYFIFAETLNQAGWMQLNDVLISLNPLPGSLVGWRDVFWKYRINVNVPYSTLGEVFAYSVSLGLGFCVFLGLLVGKINKNITSKTYLGIVQAILIFYVAILIPQYNLRSAARFLYLILFLELGFHSLNFFKLCAQGKVR
ncbi:hypothetical protein [Pseudocolwellia sp. HL-MZ7]|uniref:hypothetical protein n=1 Tax=Pseudocolwellia sp. HL-MZ7 TaxID=3400627 RepID=UPI003CF26C95